MRTTRRRSFVRIFQGVIRLYAGGVSPLLGQHCRFHPSCSSYAHEALEKHGVLKGFSLSLKRIFKCHPFYKGPFYDPVPERSYVKKKGPND